MQKYEKLYRNRKGEGIANTELDDVQISVVLQSNTSSVRGKAISFLSRNAPPPRIEGSFPGLGNREQSLLDFAGSLVAYGFKIVMQLPFGNDRAQ